MDPAYTLPRRITPPSSSCTRSSSSSSGGNNSNGSSSSSSSSRSCCFSFAAYARGVMDQLRRRGVAVAPGLSDDEFSRIESQLCFVFPPELRAMLTEGLPLGGAFPDWRAAAAASASDGSATSTTAVAPLRARMQQPVAGVCREVARGRFWCPQWGARPAASDAAVRAAAAAMAAAPPLVPIHGRCYIPSSTSSGNPILHVHGARVACVGNDLADFFDRAPFSTFSASPAAAASASVLEVEEDDDQDGDDPALHGSCLRSLDSLARNPEAFLFFRRSSKGSLKSSSSRRLLMSRSAEASPRPSVSSNSSSSSGGGICGGGGEPPRRSIDVASLRRRGRKNKHAAAAAAAAAPPPPIEALLGFSMAAPPWTAKAARRVEFWSELMDLQQGGDLELHSKDLQLPKRSFSRSASVDRKQGNVAPFVIDLEAKTAAATTLNLEAAPAPEDALSLAPPCLSLVPVAAAAAAAATAASNQGSAAAAALNLGSAVAAAAVSMNLEQPAVTVKNYLDRSAASLTCSSASSSTTRWLDVYLHDMAGRLRVGGWKEDDISEMMIYQQPKQQQQDQQQQQVQQYHQHLVNRQSVIRGLAVKVGQLSDSLKRAGWSGQDVAEALGSSSPCSTLASWSEHQKHQQHQQQSQQQQQIALALAS